MPIEPAIVFYPKYWTLSADFLWKGARWLDAYVDFAKWLERSARSSQGVQGTSMTPVVDDREAGDELEMIHTHAASANRLQRAHIHMHDEATAMWKGSRW